MSWIKSLAFVLAAVSIFSCGYKYAASLYEADIADLQAQHALAIQEKTNEYRAKEQHQAEALVAAWDQLEQARAESVDLRADVDRVRRLADDYRAKCPEPVPIPAHLSESDSPAAQNFSKKVQNYLLKVQSLLKE